MAHTISQPNGHTFDINDDGTYTDCERGCGLSYAEHRARREAASQPDRKPTGFEDPRHPLHAEWKAGVERERELQNSIRRDRYRMYGRR